MHHQKCARKTFNIMGKTMLSYMSSVINYVRIRRRMNLLKNEIYGKINSTVIFNHSAVLIRSMCISCF